MDYEALHLFIKLILFLIALVFVGEPLRFFISKYTSLFRERDIIQICVLNVYLAGLIYYTIAMIPLHLFDPFIIWDILVMCITITILLHLKTLKKIISILKNEMISYEFVYNITVLKKTIVFFMFFILLWVEVIPLSNYIFGNVHDSSLFGLFVKLILLNKQAPVTTHPFGTEGVIYPQGFFVLEAIACQLLGFSTAEVTLRITPLFMALTIFGAYYLGKKMYPEGHLDVSLAFTFFCISRWPRLLTWGSNALIGAFPLYLILISFIPIFINLSWKKNISEISIISILYGYLAAIHLVFYEILFFTVILTSISFFLRNIKTGLKQFINFVFFCIISIIPISISIYHFIIWHPQIGHNIGLPIDVVLQQEEWAGGIPILHMINRISTWVFTYDWISHSVYMKYYLILFFIIGTFSLLIIRKNKLITNLNNLLSLNILIILSCSILILLSTAEALLIIPFFTSIAIITVQIAETVILILTSLFLITGLYILIFTHYIYKFTKTIHNKPDKKGEIIKYKKFNIQYNNILFISLIILLLTPVTYTYCFLDQRYINGQYNMYCVTQSEDYHLMLWMKDLLMDDSIILINPDEAGGFIPLVSNYKVIYSPGASRYSLSYGNLIQSINNANLNSSTFELLEKHNVTHLFVGSAALFNRQTWDPLLFLGNPNFKLLKQIGRSSLFKVNLTSPYQEITFLEDFEQGNLTTKGWIISTSSDEGLGYANLTLGKSYSGIGSFKITSKNLGEDFWCSIHRRVYVPENHNVFISFYFDVDKGFNGSDSLILIVSDPTWKKQLFFSAIPNRRGLSVVNLPMINGYYHYNLSNIWQDTYNSTLPTSFYLQILNYDQDGIENLAFIDSIEVGLDYPSSPIKFWDDFEYENIHFSGWLIGESGNGSGNISIFPDSSYQGNKCIRMSSITNEGTYWNSFHKPIKSFWNASSVKLSLYLNASEGFGEWDALNLIISDSTWKRQMFFSTNNKTVATGYLSSEGYQEVDLTRIWRNTHNSTLPELFFIQIQNIDTDQTENVAYIDLIKIKVETK